MWEVSYTMLKEAANASVAFKCNMACVHKWQFYGGGTLESNATQANKFQNEIEIRAEVLKYELDYSPSPDDPDGDGVLQLPGRGVHDVAAYLKPLATHSWPVKDVHLSRRKHQQSKQSNF